MNPTSQSKTVTYTLDELAKQYRTTIPVIQVQLDRLKSEGKGINVTDDEVSVFLNDKHWVWPVVFWTMTIAAILYLGVWGE